MERSEVNAIGGAEIVTVGSTNVAKVASHCLGNLDMAALSVGVVIESVSSLLPKVSACYDITQHSTAQHSVGGRCFIVS